jgi:hypothetical protein
MASPRRVPVVLFVSSCEPNLLRASASPREITFIIFASCQKNLAQRHKGTKQRAVSARQCWPFHLFVPLCLCARNSCSSAREPDRHSTTPAGERGLTPGEKNADGTRSAQGCLNRTGLAYVKSLRTAGEEHAKLTNSALRCEAQTGRARVLAALLRDISRNLKPLPTSLRIRWWTPVQWVRRPCFRGAKQRPFTPHPSQLRGITNMVHIVKRFRYFPPPMPDAPPVTTMVLPR